MSEDSNITVSLQNLELGSSTNKEGGAAETTAANPFARRKRSKSLSSVNNMFGPSCACRKNVARLKSTTFKRAAGGSRKILRDPVLKLVGRCPRDSCAGAQSNCAKSDDLKCKFFGQCSRLQDQDFRSIVRGCEQLSLANANDGVQDYLLPSFKCARVRCEAAAGGGRSRHQAVESNINNSCSHQARMNVAPPPPCDVTIDELASYFETFVYIPKKMSSMAEMMYI